MKDNSEIITGIILGMTLQKENDALVNVLTNDGIVRTFYSRGILKSDSKNSRNAFPFSLCEITYLDQGRNINLAITFHSVKNIAQEKNSNHLRGEIISRLSIHEKKISFLDALNAIHNLDNKSFYRILFKWLENEGLIENKEYCSLCNRGPCTHYNSETFQVYCPVHSTLGDVKTNNLFLSLNDLKSRDLEIVIKNIIMRINNIVKII